MYCPHRIHILITPLMQLSLSLINELVDGFVVVAEGLGHVFLVAFFGTAAFFFAGGVRFLDFDYAWLAKLLGLLVR